MSKVSLTVAEDVRYTVLRIGDRKRQTHDVPSAEEWDDVCTFFIYNLGQEEVGLAYSVRVCLALRPCQASCFRAQKDSRWFHSTQGSNLAFQESSPKKLTNCGDQV